MDCRINAHELPCGSLLPADPPDRSEPPLRIDHQDGPDAHHRTHDRRRRRYAASPQQVHQIFHHEALADPARPFPDGRRILAQAHAPAPVLQRFFGQKADAAGRAESIHDLDLMIMVTHKLFPGELGAFGRLGQPAGQGQVQYSLPVHGRSQELPVLCRGDLARARDGSVPLEIIEGMKLLRRLPAEGILPRISLGVFHGQDVDGLPAETLPIQIRRRVDPDAVIFHLVPSGP